MVTPIQNLPNQSSPSITSSLPGMPKCEKGIKVGPEWNIITLLLLTLQGGTLNTEQNESGRAGYFFLMKNVNANYLPFSVG